MKLFLGIFAAALILLIGARFYEGYQLSQSKDDTGEGNAILSTNGLHWHPTLSVSIRGETIEIPPNIGLIGEHNPMHTHDTDGVIHLEFERVVRENDIRLSRFFELWGKEFNSTQIFDSRNSETEKVRMFVNGEENFEFENYMLGEEDVVEIRFE